LEAKKESLDQGEANRSVRTLCLRIVTSWSCAAPSGDIHAVPKCASSRPIKAQNYTHTQKVSHSPVLREVRSKINNAHYRSRSLWGMRWVWRYSWAFDT
jgi:hypothetical protein